VVVEEGQKKNSRIIYYYVRRGLMLASELSALLSFVVV